METTIQDIKKTIEQRAGVPASLLNGETAEEVIAHAKALLAFKKEHEAQRPKSTQEQFTEWNRQLNGIETGDEAGEALADIENSLRPYAVGIRDAGEIEHAPDGRTAQEQFKEWWLEKTAIRGSDLASYF